MKIYDPKELFRPKEHIEWDDNDLYDVYHNVLVTFNGCYEIDSSNLIPRTHRINSLYHGDGEDTVYCHSNKFGNWTELHTYDFSKFQTHDEMIFIRKTRTSHWGHHLIDSFRNLRCMFLGEEYLPTDNICLINKPSEIPLKWREGLPTVFNNDINRVDTDFIIPHVVRKLYVPKLTKWKDNCVFEHWDTLRRYGDGFRSDINKHNIHKKIYLSRQSQKKRVVNKRDIIEKTLEKEGWTMIELSDYSINDQINMIENAESIAGEFSSAFHTLSLAKNINANIICQCPQSLDMIWCRQLLSQEYYLKNGIKFIESFTVNDNINYGSHYYTDQQVKDSLEYILSHT